MNRSRSGCSTLLVIIFLALVILALGLVFNVVSSIPTKAKSLFGPASDRLSTSQYYMLSYKLVADQELLLTPGHSPDGEVQFTITQDEPIDSILLRLKSIGLIQDSEAVRNYLIFSGLDTRIQSGDSP